MVIADLSNKRASGWRLKGVERWSYLDFWLGSVSVKGMVNQNSEAGLSMVIIVPSDVQWAW